jgi:NPCBM/NEW2 domain-containing protein
MRNPKSEIRMTNQARMTKPETTSIFVIRISDLIRHSDFGFRILAALLFLSLVSRSPAATWNLTDSQFHSRSISVDSIDAGGIHSGSAAVPWEDVLEIWKSANAAPASAARFMLIFRSGDKLSGEPVSFDGQTLRWNTGPLGQIGFSVDSVLGIVRGGYAEGDLDRPRTDDVVRLANGDTTHGIVNQITPAGVTIQSGDATPTPGWDAIDAVLFSTAPANPAGLDRRSFRVRLAGDDAISVPDVALTGDQLTITLDDKSTRQIDAASVLEIEQLNGPISWLTSRKPSADVYRPMFSENFPTRFDRTVADGRPIAEKYPGFHHGIGCHSYSKLVYDLDGKWAGFRTQFAVDSDSPLADVTVRIYLDDKVVVEQKNVKAGRIYPVTVVGLGAAKTISLEVDYGENYATQDRFVWLDPALLRKMPEAATQPDAAGH